jgi:hypothetical protein
MDNLDLAIVEWLAKAKPDYTKIISGRKGVPDNQDLYNQVKADAQKKFDVYPSAVANGWVVQEYKRRGGTYSKPVEKGDIKGHVFRGNQHSVGGVSAFDVKNLVFASTCASGHANTVKVPDTWVERNPDGSITGQFAASSQSRACSTCSRPIDNRWTLVAGQRVLPNPKTPENSQYAQLGIGGQNYVQTTSTPPAQS